MATGTLRLAIIVALAIGGAALIARFPEGGRSVLDRNARPSERSHTPSPSATTQESGTGGTGQQTSTPEPVKGARVAVYNGTFETGLAAAVAESLVTQFDYRINGETSILDAPSKPLGQTTIYFVTPEDRPAADELASTFFKKLDDVRVTKLPPGSEVPDGVQLAVYLGQDYALLR